MVNQKDFQTLATSYRILPIWKRFVADMATPVAAFNRVVGEGSGFLLESVEDSQHWSRFSFIGRNPIARFVANEMDVKVECFVDDRPDAFAALPTNQGMLKLLEEFFASFNAPKFSSMEVPFWGGVAGYLGYDVVREIENIPNSTLDDRQLPDAIMEVIGQLAVFDHWKQQVVLIDNVLIPPKASKKQIAEVYDLGMDRLTSFSQSGTIEQSEPLLEVPELERDPKLDFKRSISAKDYEAGVNEVIKHIHQGDVIQTVLSERFEFNLEAAPLDVYRVLRQINPSPYMFFMRYDDMTILGSSPEALVKVQDGKVISRPIAGTRPRGKTEKEDRRLGAELLKDPKEVSEHIMLVDLARNDIGKVVQYGSLEVEELMVLEKFSHVLHLTSQVVGELRPEFNSLDVLRATFPAGTISGAPKIKAMEIIDSLEPVKRGPYSGMVGYLDFSGNLDSAIAIRTMVCKGQVAWVQVGAGVVIDSVGKNEELECQNKAKVLLAAVVGAQKMAQSSTETGRSVI